MGGIGPSVDKGYRPLSAFCAIVLIAAGGFALFGWLSGKILFTGMTAVRIPMTHTTALFFILFGISLLLRLFLFHISYLRLATFLTVSACGITSLILFGISLFGRDITGASGTPPPGQISPVSALCFAMAAFSFFSLSSSPLPILRHHAGRIAAIFLITANSLFLIAYLYGTSILYVGLFVPSAASTVTFLILGAALYALAPSTSRRDADDNIAEKRDLWVMASLFMLLALGITVSVFIYYRNFENRYRNEAEKRLSAIADLKVNDMALWRKERLGDAAVFYRNPAFASLAARHFSDPADLRAESDLRGWLQLVQRSYQYEKVWLLDGKKRIRISVPEAEAETDPVIVASVSRAMASGEVTFLDFHRHGDSGPVHFSILIPILRGNGESRPLGTVLLWIDPGRYLYPFIRKWPIPSDSGETLLVRREGDDVVFLHQLRFSDRLPLTLRIPISRANLPAAKAVLGKEGTVEGKDYRGVPVAAALRQVPGSPWFLVAKMDLTEIYAPLRERLLLVTAMVAVFLLGAGAGVWLLWKQRSEAHHQLRLKGERERARLYDLVERSLNKIYIFDPGTLRITFANRAAWENTGYSAEEILDLTLPDIEPEFSHDSFRTMAAPLVSGERKRLIFETSHRKKDGSTYPVEVYLQLMDTEQGSLFLAVVNDISERKAHEAALLESEEKLRLFIRHAPASLAMFDREMRYLHTSRRWLSDYRLDGLDLRGRCHYDVFPDIPLEWRDVHRRCLGGEVVRAERDRFQRADGTVQWLRWEVRPWRGASGGVGGVLIFTEDISELVHSEEELRSRNKELEQLNYTVSHDLKSPLVTVNTFLGYLAQDMKKGDTLRIEQDMMYMRTATTRMGHLLEDLFDLTRLGRIHPPPVDVTFNDLAREAVTVVAGRISERGVCVSLEDKKLTLHGDRPRLIQLWQNLIENAVKFMGDQPDPRIEIGVEKGEGDVTVFFVKDNGQGIDPRHSERIFGLFEKLDPGGEGTGIGLAMVKRIVELYEGRLWMESEGKGKGATFFFTLPRAVNTI